MAGSFTITRGIAMSLRYQFTHWSRSLLHVLVPFLIASQILSADVARADDRLTVLDPQNQWRNRQGTIEEAILSVRPRGLYMEHGVYLTFSARGSDFQAHEQLEVELFFDLPKEAIVNDLWLWVGDDIVRATIMDQWTASTVYENIVQRRRDPAILFKRGGGRYELRIYPMRGDESRKIKLTYLMPTDWSQDIVSAALPSGILKASRFAVPRAYVLAWPGAEWSAPQISEHPDLAFVQMRDPAFGSYLQAKLSPQMTREDLTLSYASPMKDGVYVNRFTEGGEGVYQLAFLPSEALSVGEQREIAVLVDYQATNTGLSSTEVLESVRRFLQANLTAGDSFNLILSQLNIKRASEMWLPADSATIDDLFNTLGSTALADYSNLPALLSNGIDFVQRNGGRGEILLVSSSDQVGDNTSANRLLSDLTGSMNPRMAIHIADFQDRNIRYHQIGGRQYKGNEYFYLNLARTTTGNFLSVREEGSLSVMLSNMFDALSGLITSFDLHTTLDDGFCFARFTTGLSRGIANVSRPILQVGRYLGSFPFVIEASGVHEEQAFNYKVEVPASEIHTADSLNETIWVGKHIDFLESEEQTNAVIGEIISYSIRQRVLSLYTAFLALEPSDTVMVCLDCKDESGLVTVQDELPSDSAATIEVYPNPFADEVTIDVHLPAVPSTMEISIFDMMGRRIRTFADLGASERLRLTWDGKSDSGVDVSNGVYFAVATTQTQKLTAKLVRVR